MKLNFIVCCDSKGGIACEGEIPWNFAEDMKHFRETTIGGIVIMGRRTWRTLKRELPGRHTIVMTRRSIMLGSTPPEMSVGDLIGCNEVFRCTAQSSYDAMEICKLIRQYRNDPQVWIAGGQEIYELFIKEQPESVGKIYLTQIDRKFDCDRHFPFDLINTSIEDQKSIYCENKKTGNYDKLTFSQSSMTVKS